MSRLPELPQTSEFKEATEAVLKFTRMPNEEDALSFYGLYKFGCHGRNPNAAPTFLRPYEGKKWIAWNKVSESGITPEEAQAKYVYLYLTTGKKYETPQV